jgi:phosphoribosylanthranilate isomerase
MSVKVKICGITSVADALTAAEAGADAIGLNFYDQSPRYVALPLAATIARELPPPVLKVGVFVDAPEEVVARAISECTLNLLQFHGEESPEYCMQFGLMSIKAFRIRDAASLERLRKYPTHAWLLDAFTPGQLGGTGHSFDWTLAVAATRLGRPIFLAGGLTPENVAGAVAVVNPYGVDVSSGVESAPGRKDPEKMRAFVRAAKTAGRIA